MYIASVLSVDSACLCSSNAENIARHARSPGRCMSRYPIALVPGAVKGNDGKASFSKWHKPDVTQTGGIN